MAAALPHNFQLKLDQTLAQWRQWRAGATLPARPREIEILTGGISNMSVLVAAGDRRFVVRLDGVNPATLGLNRQGEWRALHSASQQGLAPTPCYFNPEVGSLVCTYLPPDEAPGDSLVATAKLLRAIHRLPSLHHRLDPRERILRYEKQLQHRRLPLPGALADCRLQVMRQLEQTEEHPQGRVLCHNDLLRANRLHSAGQLWAIDWEYCAMGSPWFDLAVVVVGDDLTPELEETLLREYLARDPDDGERRELQRQTCVYRYLELLWYAALERESDTAQRRLEQLQLALEKTASP